VPRQRNKKAENEQIKEGKGLNFGTISQIKSVKIGCVKKGIEIVH